MFLAVTLTKSFTLESSETERVVNLLENGISVYEIEVPEDLETEDVTLSPVTFETGEPQVIELEEVSIMSKDTKLNSVQRKKRNEEEPV
jgi:hypothetical protein